MPHPLGTRVKLLRKQSIMEKKGKIPPNHKLKEQRTQDTTMG